MTDDIVTRLRDRYPDVVHPHVLRDAELVGEAAREIERLRDELKDADDDFHALKAMFDNMRDDRDRWFKIARDLYVWSIGILGEHMTTPEVQAYERAVRDE